MRHALLTLALLTIMTGCRTETDPYADGEDVQNLGALEGTYANAYAPTGSDKPAARGSDEGRVALVDHGLRMTRGTQVMPRGWRLNQNIATDPNTGQYMQYVNEMHGPNGELIRALGHQSFASMMGTSMEQAWRDLVRQGLPEVQQLSLGPLQRSAQLEQVREFQRVRQIWGPRGMQMHGLEATVRGMRQGQPVEGVAYAIVFDSPQMPGVGTVQVSVVLSRPEQVAATVRTHLAISNSYQANPAFEQRLEQINAQVAQRQQSEHQQRMASSQAAHRQRMAANQAQFDAHQQMMRDRSSAMDQQHQQFMGQLRNDNTSAWSGGDYSSHESFIDGIYERSTFQDPYSGYQVHQDGQYDYWYQNNLGEYYGTDDPSFDPNSLQGNWEQIEPLTP